MNVAHCVVRVVQNPLTVDLALDTHIAENDVKLFGTHTIVGSYLCGGDGLLACQYPVKIGSPLLEYYHCTVHFVYDFSLLSNPGGLKFIQLPHFTYLLVSTFECGIGDKYGTGKYLGIAFFGISYDVAAIASYRRQDLGCNPTLESPGSFKFASKNKRIQTAFVYESCKLRSSEIVYDVVFRYIIIADMFGYGITAVGIAESLATLGGKGTSI